MKSMEYIRSHYQVPARRGGRITFQGKPGKITGAKGTSLLVRLDEKPAEIVPIHPTWRVEYAEENGPARRVPLPGLMVPPSGLANTVGEPAWSGV